MIHDIAPNYENRNGGYTRIVKIGNRKNDNAMVSLIEFVDMSPTVVDVKADSDKSMGDAKE